MGEEIPDEHYFCNIFLHNNDYHRIHCPVNGTVEECERIEGELVVLRPWIHKDAPSLPAFRNERVNLRIREKGSERPWFLSIVGGPAVAGIRMHERTEKGDAFTAGEELGTFLLGSTLCMAAPLEDMPRALGSRTTPGEAIEPS